jgi:tetratricopeptide (TPR) repeat protein
LHDPNKPLPAFRIFLTAFLGVFLLVLLAGGSSANMMGFGLLLPGLAILFKPPTKGLGKLGDLSALGLLVCLSLAFIPQFYWPSPQWKVAAVEGFGIQLPLILSVQPLISLEAWITVVAGFAWFYSALQWPINHSGRERLFCYLSIVIALLAGVVVGEHMAGRSYSNGLEDSVLGFFSSQQQMANFLTLGGIATFAYSMEGFRLRAALPLVGLPASALCLAGLVLSDLNSSVQLYFIGVVLWFMLCLRAHLLQRSLKILLPLFLSALLVFVLASGGGGIPWGYDRAVVDPLPEGQVGVAVFKDAVAMVREAPISGFGLGNFSAVFPQYRDASVELLENIHPGSGLLWLATEGGLLAVGLMALILVAYFRCCRGLMAGASRSYRVLALVVVSVFLILCLLDVSGHRLGVAYFGLLFAALALPKKTRSKIGLAPAVWRVLGIFLVLIGLIWIAAGAFGRPWHSSQQLSSLKEEIDTRIETGDHQRALSQADQWIAIRPLDWRAYFKRAQIALLDRSDLDAVAADFRRARFVEPSLSVVSFEEGKAWLPYDGSRAIAAWRDALERAGDSRVEYFREMLDLTSQSPILVDSLGRLSEIDPQIQVEYLCYQKGGALMRELDHALSIDPGLRQFNRAQRTAIVENWIKEGDVVSAEAFLQAHEDTLRNSWWLWSLLHSQRADFIDAVEGLRENLEQPEIPGIRIEEMVFERLLREHAVAPNDIIKGMALFLIYVEREEYEKALPIIDRLIDSPSPPPYLYYWRAEALYRLEEYIESWYTFETYLNSIWGKSPEARR